VAAPVFNPGGGTFGAAQNVTITSATSGATIRYTLDGSAPSQSNGTVYSGPVAIATSKTLKAIAFKTGFTDSTVTSSAYTIQYSLTPAADAYVRDGGNAGNNYGSAATLEVKNTATSGNNRNAYLRFAISSLPASFSSAKVRVYGAAATSAKACSIYAVSDIGWVESAITWTTAPAAGAKQGSSVTIGTTSQYYDFDVTAYLQSERGLNHGAVSFMLKNDVQTVETQTSFNSNEAASNRPILLVQ
jgi:hypothetical protein